MNAIALETIPVEASEVEDFVPSSLANLPIPPVFKLRAAGGREWRKYQYIMRAEGLQYHSPDDLRAETIRALKSLYSADQAAAAEARLISFWEMVKQEVEIPADEQEAVQELTGRLVEEWRPLAKLGADNMRFGEESLRIAISMFCIGWTGIDLGYRREDGRTPLGLIDDLEDKLQEIEKQGQKDKVDGVLAPGIAFIQLANACYRRLRLTGDEEKNSDSPPSSQPTPNGSTMTPSRSTEAARSKGSASSKPRRKASSASKGPAKSQRAATASAS